MHTLDFFLKKTPFPGKFQIGLVTWHEIQSKLQWGVIILMGGGFAMAEGSKRSCLSQWLSEKLSWLGGFHSHVLQVTTAVFTTLLTEFMSNAAAASIIQPILAQLAVGAEINPLFVMIPAAYGEFLKARCRCSMEY